MRCYRIPSYKITLIQTNTADIYIYDGDKKLSWFKGPRPIAQHHIPIPTLNLTLRGVYDEVENLFKDNKET